MTRERARDLAVRIPVCCCVGGRCRAPASTAGGEDVLAHVGERLAVLGLPGSDPARVPDLHPVERADHDHVAVEAGVLLSSGGMVIRPCLSGLVLGRPHRQEPAVLTGLTDRERRLLDAAGHRREVGAREDGEAEVLTLRHHESLRELLPELGREEEPVLLVELRGVGAHEHPGTSTSARPIPPLRATVLHFAPPSTTFAESCRVIHAQTRAGERRRRRRLPSGAPHAPPLDAGAAGHAAAGQRAVRASGGRAAPPVPGGARWSAVGGPAVEAVEDGTPSVVGAGGGQSATKP